jgi:hypothetical protein
MNIILVIISIQASTSNRHIMENGIEMITKQGRNKNR